MTTRRISIGSSSYSVIVRDIYGMGKGVVREGQGGVKGLVRFGGG